MIHGSLLDHLPYTPPSTACCTATSYLTTEGFSDPQGPFVPLTGMGSEP